MLATVVLPEAGVPVTIVGVSIAQVRIAIVPLSTVGDLPESGMGCAPRGIPQATEDLRAKVP